LVTFPVLASISTTASFLNRCALSPAPRNGTDSETTQKGLAPSPWRRKRTCLRVAWKSIWSSAFAIA